VSTECKLDVLETKDVEVRFDGGTISTDAGLSVFIEWMKTEGCLEPFVGLLEAQDSRDPDRTDHSIKQLLRQRVLQIVAGYEDANDSDELKDAPLFQAATGRVEEDQANASQPTMSRLENAVNARTVVKLNRRFLDRFLDHRDDEPDELILGIDSTGASAHGRQQRALFDGYRGQTQYHPLMIVEETTGAILSVRLRDGRAHDKHRAVPQLKRVLDELTNAYEDTVVRFRADDGFTDPRIYRLLDEYDVEWTINYKTNAVLKRRTEDLLDNVQDEYERTGTKATQYRLLEDYRANSWETARPVVAKVESGPNGTNRRFVVCSDRPEFAQEAFDFYEERGVCEQYIKEFKGGYRGEKLSCHRFVANAFRLVMYAIAYTMVVRFRRDHLSGTELEDAWIETIRRKLFKLGARIEVSVRRFWIHATEDWPYQDLFKRVARSVRPQPG
jgi:hypothetical protein